VTAIGVVQPPVPKVTVLGQLTPQAHAQLRAVSSKLVK
jgi:hypothetical protein